MKKLIIATVSLLAFGTTFAQRSSNNDHVDGQTSFYAELGGPGILFSANIDRRFKASHLGWGGRAGIGFVSGYIQTNNNGYYERPSSVVTFPVQINYVFGKGNSPHTFEVGGGVTIAGRKLDVFDYSDYDDRRSQVFGSASFMYRRQPVHGGFSWRIGFTPLFARGYIQPTGGVSVGYNF